MRPDEARLHGDEARLRADEARLRADLIQTWADLIQMRKKLRKSALLVHVTCKLTCKAFGFYVYNGSCASIGCITNAKIQPV